jgi:hypothetical protein
MQHFNISIWSNIIRSKSVMVGGAAMYPKKTLLKMQLIQKTDISSRSSWSSRNTSRKRTFTVFAPTNAAFAKLPMGTVETLLKPEKKTDSYYHVVSGKMNAADIAKAIKAGNGKATLKQLVVEP